MEKELIINIKFNKQREPVFTLQNDDGNSLLDDTDVFNVNLSTTARLVKIQNKTWDNGSMKLENLKVYEYKQVNGQERLVSVARYEIGKSFYVKLDEIPANPDSLARINFLIVDYKRVHCSLSFNYYENVEKLIAATAEVEAVDETPDELSSFIAAENSKDTVTTVPSTVVDAEVLTSKSDVRGFGLWGVFLLAAVMLIVAAWLWRRNRNASGKGSRQVKVVGNATDSANDVVTDSPAAIVMVDEPVTYSVPKSKSRTFEQQKPVETPKPVSVMASEPVMSPQQKSAAANTPAIRCSVPLSQHRAFTEIADMLDKLLYESSHTSGNAYSNLLTHINMRYLNFRHQVEDIDTAERCQDAILDQFGSPYNWICEVVRLSAYLQIDQSMQDMCACVKLDSKVIEAIYNNTVMMCEDYGVRLVVPALFKDMYIRSRYIALDTPLITKFIPEEFKSRSHFAEDTIYDVLQPGCIVSTGEVKLPVVCYIHDNNYK